MQSSKSPGLRFCESTRSVLKYRSCFNKGNESKLNKSCVENFYGTSNSQQPSQDVEDSSSKEKSTTNKDTLPSIISSESVYCSISSSESNIGDEVIKKIPKKKNVKPKDINGYVGFANLPNQIYWKAVQKGFELTIMIVGSSGLGKSTLINSLFLTDIYNNDYPGPTQRTKKTMSIETTKVLLKEGGVNLELTVVDTPGFGDAVDNSNCWTPIINFIENRYDYYLQAEMKVNRKVIKDMRVHCCLFCIQASGHGLKPLDIELMKRLCDKVNIVPIITKADTLTSDECRLFKEEILREIREHKIKIYNFPSLSAEDEEYDLNESLRKKVPFAVVGSNTVIEVSGKRVRGREYPWGIIDIENPDHCDFSVLKKMLICTHLEDLKNITHNVHYEKYRHHILSSIMSYDVGRKSLVYMNSECDRLEKLELELKKEFENKVRDNMDKFNNYKEELKMQMEAAKENLAKEKKELEEKWLRFELEKCYKRVE